MRGRAASFCYRARYDLLNPLRRFVIVYVPFGATDALSELPGHSAVGSMFAIIRSSVLIALGVPSARCPCQMSSRAGDVRSVSKTPGGPPLRGPLFITTTLG